VEFLLHKGWSVLKNRVAISLWYNYYYYYAKQIWACAIMGSVFFFHLSQIKNVVEFNKKNSNLVVFTLGKQNFPETSQFLGFFSTTVQHQIKTLIG